MENKSFAATAEKVNARYPQMWIAYKKDPPHWAWLCIYCTTAAEVLTVEEISEIVKLSNGYAGGRARPEKGRKR